MKKIFVATALCAAISTPAFAIGNTSDGGLFLEPAITWESGSSDLDLPSPFSNSEADLDGFGVGMRLGFHAMESFFIGVDGRYSFLKFEENKLGMDTDAKSWNIGPVVGLQMPTDLGIRVWAGYIAAGEVDPDKDRELDIKFKSGSGFRVGGGLKLALVSLNVEYQKIKYDKTELESIGIFDPGSESKQTDLDNESIVLSVSMPFAI